MSILIVGRSGQLAQAIAAQATQPIVFMGRADHDFFDIDTTKDLLARGGIKTLINTAAYTNVDRAEQEPEAAFRLNRDLPQALARACQSTGAHFIHLSTDYVFDGFKPKGQAYIPTDTTAPLNVYGQSKRDGECAVQDLMDGASLVRTSWLISRYGQNFLKSMVSLMTERESLRIIDDQWGTPTMAHDLAGFLLHSITPSPQSYGGVLHYSGGEIWTWFQIASHIQSIVHQTSPKVARLYPITTQDYPTLAKRGRNTALEPLVPVKGSMSEKIATELRVILNV